MDGSRAGQGVRTLSLKSQMAIGFLRNTGTDPLEEGSLGPNPSFSNVLLAFFTCHLANIKIWKSHQNRLGLLRLTVCFSREGCTALCVIR